MNKRGFTLIELLIVASLILVLVVVSTPLFRTAYSNLELKDSAYNIGKMMRYAEVSAVMEERAYKMVLNFENRAYWLLRENQKDSKGDFEKVEGRFGEKFFLPKNLSLSGDKSELIFLPNGRSTKATVSVIDKTKKKGFDIKTTGRSGQIEISDVSEK
ncbi:MAG: prepilin-type N-terminal cleavage/methylation domain-containing protein [Candidatus Omnitrophota bacterium]